MPRNNKIIPFHAHHEDAYERSEVLLERARQTRNEEQRKELLEESYCSMSREFHCVSAAL